MLAAQGSMKAAVPNQGAPAPFGTAAS